MTIVRSLALALGLLIVAALPAGAQTACTYTASNVGQSVRDCGTAKQNTDTDLTCFAGLSTNGIAVRTGAGTCATRQVLDFGGGGVDVSINDGVAGDIGIAFDYSDKGADAFLGPNACNFTSPATVPGHLVCEGATSNTIETRFNIVDPTTADKTVTVPDANTVIPQAATCSGTDKFSAVDGTTGAVTCSADDDIPEAGDFTAMDTSAEARSNFTDETGTGAMMFGLTTTMANDIGCTGLQVTRRNAGNTQWECATPSGVGDVVGPASATDNALTRYDTTTGKLVQDSRSALDDAGELRLFNDGAGVNPGVVSAEHFVILDADYTLANSASQQKLFNATTNGRLTLPTGTYRYDFRLYITGMSGTSGNGTFSVKGGGTATLGASDVKAAFSSYGTDDSAPGSGSTITGQPNGTTQGKPAQAATGTVLSALGHGYIRVTVAGTIIPSITLDTAIGTAVVNEGSWFSIRRIGSSTVTTVGNWD